MTAIQSALKKLVERQNLSQGEMESVFEEILGGKAPASQVGALLVALRLKGETVEELAGAASVLRAQAKKPKREFPDAVDTCGTGGDNSHTVNLSTAAALVAAGAQVRIAKHGNRAVSSRCGSADLFQSLGVNIESCLPEAAVESLQEIGISFFFAPFWHPAMKAVALVRQELGVRTIFNLLGPLLNPVHVKLQVLGVFSPQWLQPMAQTLDRLGAERAIVVHGEDGVDEITLTGQTKVFELAQRKIHSYEISPEQFGLKRCVSSDLKGGDAQENAERIINILKGEKGPLADAITLNAAAAILIGGKAKDWTEGIERAQDSIRSGSALKKLEALRKRFPVV
ncbi:MAG: anthranilate phosphoribosyltransferase [Deltaproteobacteria bacterium]|nr:anthranilate phosphoribosyltransferase [Deltaproteobacteria bacterium]